MSERPQQLLGRKEALIAHAQALRGVAIAILWAIPMMIFWYQAWDVRRPLVTLSFLSSSALGLAAVALPESHFRPKTFELHGRLYAALGVPWFGRHMFNGEHMNSMIRKLEPSYRIVRGFDSMRDLEARTREGERGHLVLLVSGIPPTIYAFVQGSSLFGAYLVIANILVNVYPILLERHIRSRIHSAFIRKTRLVPGGSHSTV